MKNLVFFLLAFVAIYGYGQNTGNFEGKYLITGTYIVSAGPMTGSKDSIDPRTVVVVNYGNQIILRNFAGADSVIADLNSNRFIVQSQSFGGGDLAYTVFGEGHFSNDTLFYHYFLGGGFDGTFDIDCKGPKDLYSANHELKENKDFLRCYPNPADQYLNIELTIPSAVDFASLEIRQLDNRLVNLIELDNRGKFNKEINIQDLNDGIFTLCLLFDNKQKYCCKIIKQAKSKN